MTQDAHILFGTLKHAVSSRAYLEIGYASCISSASAQRTLIAHGCLLNSPLKTTPNALLPIVSFLNNTRSSVTRSISVVTLFLQLRTYERVNIHSHNNY